MFEDRQTTGRMSYAGKIKLGVMVKACSINMLLERSMIDDNAGKIEFVKVKGDPNPDREFEVIRAMSDKKNVLLRVEKDVQYPFIKKEREDKDHKPTFRDEYPIPHAVPWFVVDKNPEVAKVYGIRPTILKFVCPSNDIERILPGLYKNNRGKMVDCVGNGKTARRINPNGIWEDLPYCNCGYRTGLPEKIIASNDMGTHAGDYVKVKTEDIPNRDTWRKVKTEKGNLILEELKPTCGPKVEFRFILYECDAAIIRPYVIRTKSLKSYDYIKDALHTVKDGDEETKGFGRLMGIPMVMKIHIEKANIIVDGKPIQKDDIVIIIDIDSEYGNPIRKALELKREQHALPPAKETKELTYEPVTDEQTTDADFTEIKEEKKIEDVNPKNLL